MIESWIFVLSKTFFQSTTGTVLRLSHLLACTFQHESMDNKMYLLFSLTVVHRRNSNRQKNTPFSVLVISAFCTHTNFPFPFGHFICLFARLSRLLYVCFTLDRFRMLQTILTALFFRSLYLINWNAPRRIGYQNATSVALACCIYNRNPQRRKRDFLIFWNGVCATARGEYSNSTKLKTFAAFCANRKLKWRYFVDK